MNWFKSTILNWRFWASQTHYDDTPSKLSVTVVIPAYNEEDFIRDTVESVLAQSYVCDIIVVDDSSTDKTADIVREYPSIRLITTHANQGSKSQALNYAIPYVNTDIFICVDADTVLDEDAVEKLLLAFNDENTMIACGTVLSKSHNNFWQSGRYGEYIVGQTIVKSAQQNANFVMVASGCFFGIRVPFLKKHMFNNRTMAEDMDLTWVAIEKGYRVTFVEDAFCAVSDPSNMIMYDTQISRWYRGFFQNLKVRNFNLFKNPKLGIAAYSYMLLNFIGVPILILLTVYMIVAFQVHFLLSFMAWYLVVLFYVMYQAYKMNEDWVHMYRHLFNSVAISFYTYFVFVRSAFQELVLNKKLDIWIKGH